MVSRVRQDWSVQEAVAAYCDRGLSSPFPELWWDLEDVRGLCEMADMALRDGASDNMGAFLVRFKRNFSSFGMRFSRALEKLEKDIKATQPTLGADSALRFSQTVGHLDLAAHAHRMLGVGMLELCSNGRDCGAMLHILSSLSFWTNFELLHLLHLGSMHGARTEIFQVREAIGSQEDMVMVAGFKFGSRPNFKGKLIQTCRVRPSCEGICKSLLLASGEFVFVEEESGSSSRVFFDTSDLAVYEKLVSGARTASVRLHWTGHQETSRCLPVLLFAHRKGDYEEVAVSSEMVDEILEGVVPVGASGRVRKALKGRSVALVVRSQRSVYFLRSNPEIVMLWDSHVVMTTPGRRAPFVVDESCVNRIIRNSKGDSLVFPFHVASFVSFGSTHAIPAAVQNALKNEVFLASPVDYDEYTTGIGLLRKNDVSRTVHDQSGLDCIEQTLSGDAHAWIDADVAESLLESKAQHDAFLDDGLGHFDVLDQVSSSENTRLFLHGWVHEDAKSDQRAQKRIPIDRNPKIYWANERTLLSWVNLAMLLAIYSISLLGDRFQGRRILGVVMSSITLVIACYSLIRFLLRNRSIVLGTQVKHFGVIDWWSPFVCVPIVFAFVVALMVVGVMSFGQ
jgi:uncharacterized membrane protein YidH (DUF202 family)